MKTQAALLIIFALIIASYVLGVQEDLDGRQTNYCELRSIYEKSGGQYGWPRLDGYGECK